MRTQRELSALSPLHRASMALHASLTIEHKRGKSLLSSTAKQVLSSAKHTSNISSFIENRDARERTAGQVRALNNFCVPEKNHKLEQLIEKQYEDRRQRHLNLLKRYEAWVEKLYEGLGVSEKQCIKRWEVFVRASEKELSNMINELSESSLLGKGVEWIPSAHENLNNHMKRRRDEAKNFRNGLVGLEDERERKVNEHLVEMKNDLVDTAYMLEAGIQDLISRYKASNSQIVSQKKQVSAEINEENIKKTQEFDDHFKEQLREKENLWKIVQHNNALSVFMDRIDSPRFVNPEERISLFKELSEKQIEMYSIRLKFLNKFDLRGKKHSKFSINDLTKQYAEERTEELNKINDKYQELYDGIIKKAMDLQVIVFTELDELIQVTQDKISFIAAYDSSKLEEIIENTCKSLVSSRKSEWADLLTKVIRYLEETDTRSQEVATSCLAFIKSLAQASDEERKRNSEEEKKYSTDVALRGDQLDENVENIEERFKSKVHELSRSITHQDLEKALNECMGILEEEAVENRRYVEDVSELISLHPYKIINSYLNYLIRILEKFGFYPIERRDDVIALLRQKRGEITMKLKTPEEAKRRVSSIKDPNEGKITMDIEEVEILGRKWLVYVSTEEIVKDIMTTEEDREKEVQKRIREEEKRKEDERKALEDAQRREEMKKSKTKAPIIKQEEPKREDLLLPPMEPEKPKEEILQPIDPSGTPVLLDTLVISTTYISSLLCSLQSSFSQYISDTESSSITANKDSDKELLENIRQELDEKLRYLWPRKGKLEVNEFSTRSIEIKRHHNRWDRFVMEINPRRESHTKEFSTINKELTDFLVKYKKEQDSVRLQLPKSTSIAEFQGLLRKNKDLELQLFHKGSEIIERLTELAVTEIEKIFGSGTEFVANLQLFEDGGNYDAKEVEYYQDKLKVITTELSTEQSKRKDIIEVLKKKFEVERTDPVKAFEKDYGTAVELLAAKEGIGKKYGAPKRSAQEKIRGEMTKCEKAQEGIDSILSNLSALISEFRSTLASKSEPFFVSREPSLAISIRKVLISLRLSMQKYGIYITAFKDENSTGLKSITWKEDSIGIGPTPEETSNEGVRLEAMLEPLQELAVVKTSGNFTQKIAEIEKNARDECAKLYQGKGLPEAVDKYFRIMKYYSEEFRINRCKLLREAAVKAFELQNMLAEATIRSLELGAEFSFEQACEKIDGRFAVAYENEENLRKKHKKLLRPNLANPSCSEDLEKLNSEEVLRYQRASALIIDSLSDFSKNVKGITEGFRVKLSNNSEILLYLFDTMFIYEDFTGLPGDEAPEIKRSNIKALYSKKKQGKGTEITDPRGKKKNWPILGMSALKFMEESVVQDIPQMISYKAEGQKALILQRNRALQEYLLMFEAKVSEYSIRFDELKKDEEGWNAKWRTSVESLRSKNT